MRAAGVDGSATLALWRRGILAPAARLHQPADRRSRARGLGDRAAHAGRRRLARPRRRRHGSARPAPALPRPHGGHACDVLADIRRHRRRVEPDALPGALAAHGRAGGGARVHPPGPPADRGGLATARRGGPGGSGRRRSPGDRPRSPRRRPRRHSGDAGARQLEARQPGHRPRPEHRPARLGAARPWAGAQRRRLVPLDQLPTPPALEGGDDRRLPRGVGAARHRHRAVVGAAAGTLPARGARAVRVGEVVRRIRRRARLVGTRGRRRSWTCWHERVRRGRRRVGRRAGGGLRPLRRGDAGALPRTSLRCRRARRRRGNGRRLRCRAGSRSAPGGGHGRVGADAAPTHPANVGRGGRRRPDALRQRHLRSRHGRVLPRAPARPRRGPRRVAPGRAGHRGHGIRLRSCASGQDRRRRGR